MMRLRKKVIIIIIISAYLIASYHFKVELGYNQDEQLTLSSLQVVIGFSVLSLFLCSQIIGFKKIKQFLRRIFFK